MVDGLDEVTCNIRALIVSSKFPIPVRNLNRDYETIVGNPIPYRLFNFHTVESFLESLPSLRLTRNGRDTFVEAAQSEDSSHISKLIAKQKTTKKSFPPPKRGRGGSSYRGSNARPNYPPRPVPRDSVPRDTVQRDSVPRDSVPRDPVARDSVPNRYLNSSATSRHPNPRREIPSSSNNADFVENLVVKVVDNNTRKVSVGSAGTSSREYRPTSYELPPRFQRQRQPTPVTPTQEPMSDIAMRMEDNLYLDRPADLDPSLQEIDTNIISALKPSQLVAVGRAKEQDAQAKLDDLLDEAMQNINNAVALPSGLVADNPLVPDPDEEYVHTNVDKLLSYVLGMNWSVPTYTVFPRKPKGSGKTVYWAKVQIVKNGHETKKWSSFPEENESAIVAKGYAAKHALEDLRKEEKMRLQQIIVSSDKNMINNRVSKMVDGIYNGMFANHVEENYIREYNEQLPTDWLQSIRDCPTLSVEQTLNQTIIIPINPSLDLAEPIITSVPLGLVPPEGDTWDVFVTSAMSTSQVWFRFIGANYSDKYEELLCDMEEYYKTKGVTQQDLPIEVGQYYAAASNDGWFRVLVNKVNNETKTVNANLIDHGDSDIFAFKNLYPLTMDFCTLPRQAMKCSLSGLERFSEDPSCCEVISSCEYLIGQVLIASVNSRDETAGPVKVTLYDTSGQDDVNINEKIKEHFLLDYMNTFPKLPEGRAVKVVVSHISKEGEVFVQIPNEKLNNMIDLIDSLGPEEITKNKVMSYRQIKLNKVYLAKYSKDESWSRAVVTAPPSVQQNEITVLFMDFGNSETVSITDLVEVDHLPPVISVLPGQAIKVGLNNLPAKLTRSQIAKLHACLLGGEEKVVLTRLLTVQNDLPLVDMFHKDNNGAIVSVNLTIAEENDMFRIQHKSKDKASSSLQLNGNGFLHPALKKPQFGDDNYQPVSVVLASHPGNFVFQLKKYEKQLYNLTNQIQNYYDVMDLPELKEEEIVPGGLYAGLLDDKYWYRLIVKEGAMIGKNVPVQFIDFGDVMCVPVSCLRKLEPEFCELPFMGIKGKLAGVMPIHTDWDVEDSMRFQDLVINKSLASFIVSIEDNSFENPMDLVVSLNLIDTSSNSDIVIADILCEEKRAVRVK